MDLYKQIGSLLIIGFPGPELKTDLPICRDIVEFELGGVILFNRCLHTPDQPANIRSAAQLQELCTSLQRLSGGRLLIGVDQEGGKVRRLGPEAGFAEICSARQMGASGSNTATTRKQAHLSAAMLAEAGINCNFAPVVDLDVNRANPVIGSIERSFSAAPTIVARHAAAWIAEHRKLGILSCVKHFPGHGSSSADSHKGFVDISNTWSRAELEPYQQLLENGMIDLLMTGHLFNRNLDPAYPATLSAKTVGTLLRDGLGYGGVVVSDDLQMQAITEHYPFAEAVCRSLAAGVDMLVFGNNLDYDPDICEKAVNAVRRGIDRGIVDEKRIAEALHRVGNLKHQLDDTND